MKKMNSPGSKKKAFRNSAGSLPKSRPLSPQTSSSSASSDEELRVRRNKTVHDADGHVHPPAHGSERHRNRRASSRSSVERGHRRHHATPAAASPQHHYRVHQTCSLERNHHVPVPAHWYGGPVMSAPGTWSSSPSPWLYPPEFYAQQQPQPRSSCCCCRTPPVPCQVWLCPGMHLS